MRTIYCVTYQTSSRLVTRRFASATARALDILSLTANPTIDLLKTWEDSFERRGPLDAPIVPDFLPARFCQCGALLELVPDGQVGHEGDSIVRNVTCWMCSECEHCEEFAL